MKMIRTIAAFLGAAALLTACGGGGNDVGKEVGLQNPEIHFVHAIAGGPTVDFLVNGSALQTGIAYKTVTNFANINTGATTVAFANTGTTTALASGSFPDVAKGHEYTVIALPGLTATGADIGLIDDPFDKGLLSNSARVRGFNATANAQNLDIYIVPPGTDISSASPTLAGVAFKNAVPASGQDSVYMGGGTYIAVVTTAGSKTPIFQSASFSLANNADWLITTIPEAGTLSQLAPNQIHLLVAQGGNTSQPALELTNSLTGT